MTTFRSIQEQIAVIRRQSQKPTICCLYIRKCKQCGQYKRMVGGKIKRTNRRIYFVCEHCLKEETES